MTKSIIFIVLFIKLFAPLPPGVAINPETKECGYYWGGDEFSSYILPPPWEVYYGTTIQVGSVVYAVDMSKGTEVLCNQIGYTYLPGNVGETHGQHIWGLGTYLFCIFRLGPIAGAFLVTIVLSLLILRWANKQSSNTIIP